MGPKRSHSKQRSKVLAACSLLSVAVVVCAAAPMAAGAQRPQGRETQPLSYPRPIRAGVTAVSGRVRSASLLRCGVTRSDSPLSREEPVCPSSVGAIVTHPGMAGVALGNGPVTAIVGQSGDLVHGIVDLGEFQRGGVVRTQDGLGDQPPLLGVGHRAHQAARRQWTGGGLGDATIVRLHSTRPNCKHLRRLAGQPSGTYVKGPGSFGFQVDGSSFSEHIVVEAVLPSGS